MSWKISIAIGVLIVSSRAFAAGMFPGQKFSVGANPHAVALGDFDGDGHQDLVTANSLGPTGVTLLLGNDKRTFAIAVRYAAGVGSRSIAVGDLDADSHPDLVTANWYTDDVAVALGNGDGTFAPALRFAVCAQPLSVAVGDLNGD